MDLRINAADDVAEVLGVRVEAVVLHVDDQQFALVVLLDPGIVAFVQSLAGIRC
jgi:hypothetical protein